MSGDDGLADALLEALGLESSQIQAASSPRPHLDDDDIVLDPGVDVVWDVQDGMPGIPSGEMVVCSYCGGTNPVDDRFCGQCGASLADTARLQIADDDLIVDPNHRVEVPLDVKLVSINEDGSDGLEIPLRYTETIVGRKGDTRFPTDAFLSPHHAKLLVEEGALFIIDLRSLNGTYVRIRKEVNLRPGDCFLMGRQVLRFERFEPLVAPKARFKDGTRYMGSPPPGGTHKILQVGIGGVYQNVYCIPEAGSILGREKGDIIFPQDRFMSGRHAKIYLGEDGQYYLADLNSSNGTWIKIWSRHQLEHGDLIFLGQQLFRVEGPDLAPL